MLVALLGACALFAWSFVPGAVTGTDPEIIEIDVKAETRSETLERLAAEGVLASPHLTKLYALIFTPFTEFRARPHLLEAGSSARELVQRLTESNRRRYVKVTVVEGWTHRNIGARLREKGICSSEGFRRAVFDTALLEELDVQSPSAEGYLFPATYEFPVDARPETVVKRLVEESKKRTKALVGEGPLHPDLVRLGFSLGEIVTLASIVEKETSLREEAPWVARVFLNRLLAPAGETGGRLQSDPTAAYGCLLEPALRSCAKFDGNVTPGMLKDQLNPYNTYRHAGLPPTPISNPGAGAMNAVLHPAHHNALYFVADGKGGHTFSETYEAHERAVERLREIRQR